MLGNTDNLSLSDKWKQTQAYRICKANESKWVFFSLRFSLKPHKTNEKQKVFFFLL